MKVSSPVGNFPFELQGVRLEAGKLLLEGNMGAWPAKVELEPKDVVAFVRSDGARTVLPWVGALVAVGILVRRVNRGQ